MTRNSTYYESILNVAKGSLLLLFASVNIHAAAAELAVSAKRPFRTAFQGQPFL